MTDATAATGRIFGALASTGVCRGRRVVCGGWLVAVHDDAVATARLGRVQRAVGAGDKLIGGLAPIPPSKTGREGLALGRDRAEPLQHLGGLLDGGVGQEQAELLAAVAAQQVGGTEQLAPGGGGDLEQAVPAWWP